MMGRKGRREMIGMKNREYKSRREPEVSLRTQEVIENRVVLGSERMLNGSGDTQRRGLGSSQTQNQGERYRMRRNKGRESEYRRKAEGSGCRGMKVERLDRVENYVVNMQVVMSEEGKHREVLGQLKLREKVRIECEWSGSYASLTSEAKEEGIQRLEEESEGRQIEANKLYLEGSRDRVVCVAGNLVGSEDSHTQLLKAKQRKLGVGELGGIAGRGIVSQEGRERGCRGGINKKEEGNKVWWLLSTEDKRIRMKAKQCEWKSGRVGEVTGMRGIRSL